jgi:hypothetical protein
VIAATRGLLGAGLGLLLADKLDANTRKAVGWTLAAVGALSTLPLAYWCSVAGARASGRRQPTRASRRARARPPA